MKIYTIDYDFNRPTTKQITVGTNTEYKIGVSASKNGEMLDLTESDVKIEVSDENVLQPSGTYNGYVTFDYAQGRTPADEFAKVKIDKQPLTVEKSITNKTPGSIGAVALDANEVAPLLGHIKAEDFNVEVSGGTGGAWNVSSWNIGKNGPIKWYPSMKKFLISATREYVDEIDWTDPTGGLSYLDMTHGATADNPIVIKVTVGKAITQNFELKIEGKYSTKGDIAEGSGSGEGVKVVKVVNGKIEGYDTYAALLRDAQNGRIRLQHYVTGDASKPVLYTIHLCDDTAIRFDATGTLGSKVYTKSIAVTPSGTGYSVSIGELTQLGSKTALFEGEYEDGSTFSMNVFVKD